MPLKMKRPCLWKGCKKTSEASYCEDHAALAENARTASRAVTEPHRAIYKTREWSVARRSAIARDNHRCQARVSGRQCEVTDSLTVHHIKPLREGGAPYELSNLVTLCYPHHKQIENQ